MNLSENERTSIIHDVLNTKAHYYTFYFTYLGKFMLDEMRNKSTNTDTNLSAYIVLFCTNV